MAPLNLTSQDDFCQKRQRLDDLLQKIRQLSAKATVMPEACKDLSSQCEATCKTACQVPPATEDQYLFDVLKAIVQYLTKLSSWFYPMLKTPKRLETKMMALREELSKATDRQQSLLLPLESTSNARGLSSVSAQPSTPPERRTDVHAMTSTEVSAMQAELSSFQKDLDEAKRPQQKAQKIFESGVDCIPRKYLNEWLKHSTVEVDETTVQPARFGVLACARMGSKTVLVKRVGQIAGTSKEDTVKRTKALTHWLRHCKGIMQIKYIQNPDLIIFGSVNAVPLDVYLTQHQMTKEEKWILAFKVAGTVSYIHECKIIHRDIRAANVFMVETSGVYQPRLAGFEICRKEDVAVLSLGEREGHVWEAPERRANHGSSQSTDVFAFGVLMYEVAMGRSPTWVEYSEGTIHDKVEKNVSNWMAQVHPEVPSDEYLRLMQDCLRVNDKDRPQMSDVFFKLANGYQELF